MDDVYSARVVLITMLVTVLVACTDTVAVTVTLSVGEIRRLYATPRVSTK